MILLPRLQKHERLTIADIFSIINATCGFLTVLMILADQSRIAIVFFLFAVLADGLDGRIARRFRHGRLGEYFEAIADATSFGVVPGVYGFTALASNLEQDVYFTMFFVFILSVYFIVTMYRLGTFPLKKQDDVFIGLTTTASAMLIVLCIFLSFPWFLISLVFIGVSVGMVLPIRYPKLNTTFDGIAAILIISTMVLGDQLEFIAPKLLLTGIAVYSFFGPLYQKSKQQ